ncbi:hypothetical protein [Mesorhizobium sp.]|uniref:hypothetical protein n=1 Tax=Mesorhizobium sp. TaxID=1871066 RepID=UPI000FE5132A|nr:hypothetical protein [Mesorhizobium sp.]RWC58951.1 MAG: hypothetical protein EOS56_18775 [Mesorhizobium sp.]RWC66563.1 MAG: hypothetical protein EOS29_04130 [Mesorhizobium sp.]
MSHYYAQGSRIPIVSRPAFANKLKLLYVAVAIIAMTLQSVYLPQFGMAAFCYVGLLMLVPLLNAPIKANIFWIVAFLLIGMCGTLVTAEDGGTKTVLGTIGSTLALVLVPACFSKDPRPLLFGLRCAIAAHAAMVLFQIIYFAMFQTYFDPLASLGLADQAVISRKGLVLAIGRVPRFAGLSNEPGTHSTMIASLLVGEYALSRRLSKISIFGILSTIATMSLGGMMFVAMFCSVVGLHQVFAVRRYRLIIAAVGIALLAILIYWAMLNFETRSQLYVEGTQHDQMMEWAFSYQRITPFGLSESQIPVYFTFGYLGAGLDFLLRYGLWAVVGIATYLLTLPLLCIGLSIVLLATKLKLTYPLIFVILATINIGGGDACTRRQRQD